MTELEKNTISKEMCSSEPAEVDYDKLKHPWIDLKALVEEASGGRPVKVMTGGCVESAVQLKLKHDRDWCDNLGLPNKNSACQDLKDLPNYLQYMREIIADKSLPAFSSGYSDTISEVYVTEEPNSKIIQRYEEGSKEERTEALYYEIMLAYHEGAHSAFSVPREDLHEAVEYERDEMHCDIMAGLLLARHGIARDELNYAVNEISYWADAYQNDEISKLNSISLNKLLETLTEDFTQIELPKMSYKEIQNLAFSIGNDGLESYRDYVKDVSTKGMTPEERNEFKTFKKHLLKDFEKALYP